MAEICEEDAEEFVTTAKAEGGCELGQVTKRLVGLGCAHGLIPPVFDCHVVLLVLDNQRGATSRRVAICKKNASDTNLCWLESVLYRLCVLCV